MKARLHDHVYTLLELITAVIVICLLIVGIVAVSRYAQTRSRETVTKELVFKTLRAAAKRYRIETGAMPAEDSLRDHDPPEVHIAAFVEAVEKHNKDLLKGLRGYFRRSIRDNDRPHAPPMQIICDGWGTPLNYQIERNGDGTPSRALFIAAGPNRKHGLYENGRPRPDHDDIRSD